MIKKYSPGIPCNYIFGIILILQGCYSGKEFRALTDGKIIGFSSRKEGDKYRTGFAIINKNDSLLWIHRPDVHADIRKFYDTTRGTEEGLYKESALIKPIYAEVPFKFIKQKSGIFISYFLKGKNVYRPQYSLKKKDTVSVTDISDICDGTGLGFPIRGRSHYTGRDTTISFANVKFRCYIFEERYPRTSYMSPDRKKIVYIEKRTLIPVRIVSILDFSKNQYNNKSPSSATVFRINFIAAPFDVIPNRSKIKQNCE